MLKNSNISLLKLGKIADFLDVDIVKLLPRKETVRESEKEYISINSIDTSNQLTIRDLSDALKRNSKTIENLVQIISESNANKPHTDKEVV
jgi:hypothetical protein